MVVFQATFLKVTGVEEEDPVQFIDGYIVLDVKVKDHIDAGGKRYLAWQYDRNMIMYRTLYRTPPYTCGSMIET